MVWLNFLDKTFDTIFSSKNRNKIESYTLYASILGFIIHLILIYIKNYNILNIGFSGSLLDDPISAIYTPFSIILFYETYLLIFYLPRSFTTAISKQFEIISLIIIRKIFSDIPRINLNANWLESSPNLQLIYDLFGIIILFFLIYLFNLRKEKNPVKPISDNIKRFISTKKGVSIILLPLLIIMAIYSVSNWIYELYLVNENIISGGFLDINSIFYNEFFTIHILADVFILLLSFQYTEKYSQLIRNTGFVICTILIRLSFASKGLTNILLIVSSVLFGLIILRIYQAFEKNI
ncbi:MAG: hypothetical protein CBC76_04865 [Flavobacteriaceae bacterium TMED116]|nr:MAG: hypothetical protein CBC76_04865 [Flavobacteriaceae bacterium TMED116]